MSLVLMRILIAGFAVPSQAIEFAGGNGTPNNPYQIATAEQLIAMGQDGGLYERHFVLVADIDLDPNLPGGRVFDGPVVGVVQAWTGLVDPNFTGTLDGRGFRVRNLIIHAPADGTQALGLFGRIGREGQVRNLAVESASIRGEAGSVATGALVGINWGLVEACYATGSVTSGNRVGGLCGENRGEIRSCYASASVSGQSFVGGLIGYGGPVPSRATRGPTAGQGRVTNCYASGAVSGIDSVGGLAGIGGAAQACFWDVQASGQKAISAGGGLPTFQMMDAIVFAAFGWDQDSNWVMDDGRDYPRLVWEGTAGGPIRAKMSDRFGGEGTPRDPYHIATVEQFALLGILPGLSEKHFVLDADLDLAGVSLRPINVFNGFFHGNRHVLRHLTLEIDGALSPPYPSWGLLFGTIGPGGRVSCLGLEDVAVVINGGSCAVGVLTAVNEGVVTGCYATGTVHAGQSQSGIDLVGVNRGVLARSYTQVEVAGSNWTGGLVGRNERPFTTASPSLPARTTYSGLILECYAAQSPSKANVYGGLTGTNASLVLNSYFLTAPEEPSLDDVARRPLPPTPSKPPVGTPLTDSQMRQQGSLVGWDFAGSSSDGAVDRWHLSDANYPVLNWQACPQGLRPVPDIMDLPLDWARTELELAGFVVGEVLYDYHSMIPKERAILTSPVGLMPIGSTIDIITSRGVHMWPSSPSYSYYPPVPPFVELETPGQIECLVGRISGGSAVVLARDIDMTGWDVLPIPIPPSSILGPGGAFQGVFLGENHRISHLTSYRDGGLFDQIAFDGFVHGLRLENVLMLGSGGISVGGLAAVNNGIVLRCSVRGILLGSESTQNLGGLVGTNSGIIESCSVDVSIHGRQREPTDPKATPRTVGGMAGYNKGSVSDSCACGNVSGTGYVGGLVGRNDASISTSYAAASVAGQTQGTTGGLVGHMVIMPVLVRRGVSIAASPSAITDCYFLSPTSGGGPDNGWGTLLAAEAMRQQASFVGWDFEKVWMICEGADYPRLRWEGVSCEGVVQAEGR